MVHGFDLNFNGFQDGDPIRNKFSLVHFTLPDSSTNSYQGSFFWLPSVQTSQPAVVTFNGTTKTCSKQVRGLYYTNAQGARLWPLDQQTLDGLELLNSDYNDLRVEGGIYTTCGTSWSTDIYSLYGQVTYKKSNGTVLSRLSAGFMYDAFSNKVKTTQWLYPSLQYFNNQTPLGYIYDSVAGVGFVWGQFDASAHQNVLAALEGGQSINDIFGFWGSENEIVATLSGQTYSISSGVYAWLDTLWNISILGNVLLSRWGLDVTNRQSVLGNPSLSSSVVFSDIVNTSDILNSLRKSSDALCRGQRKFGEESEIYPTFLKEYTSRSNSTVVCVTNEQGGEDYISDQEPLFINLANPNEYDGIDIIVKGRNVVLKWSVPNKQYAINLFVDNGNVYLDNGSFDDEVIKAPLNSSNYTVFDAKGNMIAAYPDGGADQLLQKISGDPQFVVNNTNPDWKNGEPLSAPFVFEALKKLGQPWGVNYGIYIRGNIFINGILAGYNSLTKGPSSTSTKYYFHGRLASLNTALAQSEKRNIFIKNVFGDDASALTEYVDFSKVFVWQCQLNGYAGTQPCMVENDLFKYSPFILINTPVASKLLK